MASVVKPKLRKDIDNSIVLKKMKAARDKQRITQVLQHIDNSKIDNDIKYYIKNICNNMLNK